MSEIVKIDNPAKGIIGKRVDKEVVNEIEHFYECESCGQYFDMRDLGQVVHHLSMTKHKPLTGDP